VLFTGLDFDVLGKILDAAPDLVQQISPEGFLPLFAAVSGVYSGQSSRSSLYCSPLDVLLLRFLLERGADPRQLNGKRRTVMKHCAASNMIQYAKDIIDHDRAHNEGARASDPMFVDLVDAECTEEGHTPLAIALSHNRVDFALFLLEEGADANRTSAAFDSSTFVFTPLSMAVFCGSAKVVEALLNRGADVKAKSRNRDRTALSDALNRPKINHEVVRLLVDAGSHLAALSATELLALEASREGLQPDNHPNPFEYPTTGSLQFGSDVPPRFKFGSPSAAEVFGLPTNPLPTTETPFGSSANPFGSTSSSSSRSSRNLFRPRKPATTTFGRTSSPFSSFPSSSDNQFGSSNTASPFSSPSLPADPFGSTPTMSPVSSSPFAMTSTTSPVVASATLLSSNPFAAVSLIDSAKQSTPNPFQ
jgi:ankyrin repeat protein